MGIEILLWIWILRTLVTTSPTSFDSRSRVKVDGDGDDQVGTKQHDALEPVGFTVLDQVVHDQDGDEQDTRLERVEEQSHGLVDDPADNDHQWRDKQSNLHG